MKTPPMPIRVRPLMGPGLMIGAGLGGFVDGIVFHQILQWHHMLSSRVPVSDLAGMELNTLLDGVFHAGVWLLTVIGLWRLWRVRRRVDVPWSGRVFFGAGLMGFGLFNLIEGVVDHLVLGIHHVNERSVHVLAWDLGFLAAGALLMGLGWGLVRQGMRPPTQRPSDRRTQTGA